MKRIVLAICLLAFLLQGCAAVLVGGLIYKSTKSKEEKQEFLAWFHKINVERETSGLEPLSLCEEKYNFDQGWAYENPDCRYLFD